MAPAILILGICSGSSRFSSSKVARSVHCTVSVHKPRGWKLRLLSYFIWHLLY